MKRLFSQDSPYTRRARFIAILWTLLIFIGCFAPANELPKVDVPLADKWVHFILFGGFTFLWLCARPIINNTSLLILFFISIGLGSFIELMQGILAFLGRSMELMDAVADAIGALLGIGLFCLCAYFAKGKNTAS